MKLLKYSIMVYFVSEVINRDEFDCIQFNFVVVVLMIRYASLVIFLWCVDYFCACRFVET